MTYKCSSIAPLRNRPLRRRQLGVARMIMERHTECFLCISIVVILLPNFARPEECTKIYNASQGRISGFFQRGDSIGLCQYHILSPLDHYIILNLTRLVGFATDNFQRCLPSLIIQSANRNNTEKQVKKICDSHNESLPLIVQSEAENITIFHRGSSIQESGFVASYTFHQRLKEPKHLELQKECLSCHKDSSKTASTNHSKSYKQQAINITSRPEEAGTSERIQPLEVLVLLVLAPVTLFCVLCVIVLYYRKKSHCLMPEQDMSRNTARASTPSDLDVTTIASNSPLLQDNPRFSIQHHQESLRQQSAMLCRRSASTEKFPATICLKDEEETQYMRNTVLQLHKDITSDYSICRDGIRAPPNRTVSDTEMYDLEQQKSMPKALSRTSFQKNTAHTPPNRRQGKLTPNRSANDYVIDSVTHSPIHLVDSDSEGPPPYSSILAQRALVNNNLVNVCDVRGRTTETVCRPQLGQSHPSATSLSNNRPGVVHPAPTPTSLHGPGRGAAEK